MCSRTGEIGICLQCLLDHLGNFDEMTTIRKSSIGGQYDLHLNEKYVKVYAQIYIK